MDKFNLKKYLAEGKLLKEEMSLEIGDDHLKLSTDSGYYGGDINDDGTVDFSVVYYGEDDRDGMKFDRSNWKEMLGPDHAFVKISNQIPTEVESVDDYIMVKVDLEDLKGISDSAEGEPLNESSSEERWRELVKVERMIFDDESLMKKIKAGDYRFKADGPLFTRGASGMDRVDISKDGKNLFRISPPNAAKENWSLMLLDVWSGYMSYKRQKDTYEEKGIPEILRRLETLL